MERIERLLSIQESAKQFGVSQESLLKLVDQGSIKAFVLPGGGIAVDADISEIVLLNARLIDIKRSQFNYLKESRITLAEAEQKYGVPDRTIRRWIQSKYIQLVNHSPMQIRETDIAYCVAIHNERKNKDLQFGTPLLDEAGSPYLIKSPYQSEYRRRKKVG